MTNPFKQQANGSDYIDFEAYLVLPALPVPGHDIPRSIIIRLSFDKSRQVVCGNVAYEVDGVCANLAEVKDVSVSTFCAITGAEMPEMTLARLAEVEGDITIKDGVAWLPDGSEINLRALL